jgi:hypothetical protein
MTGFQRISVPTDAFGGRTVKIHALLASMPMTTNSLSFLRLCVERPLRRKAKADVTHQKLINVGLRDPFVRTIAGMATIAFAASYAISVLGSGTKAIITLALCIGFGVVLIVLRTLMRYVDSPFVRIICYASSAIIMSVFLVFAVLLIPAAVICWPQPYAQLLSLPNCALAAIEQPPFKPVPFTGTAITFDPDKGKYLVVVIYRPDRRSDAEHIVGALQSAGYKSMGIESSLDEVFATDKRPDTSLIKTSALARPAVDDVAKVVRVAIPSKAGFVSLFEPDVTFQKGNVQVDLF